LRNLLERSLLRTEPGAHELSLDLEWLKGRGIFESANAAQATPVPASRANRALSALEQQEYELIARTLASENGGIRRAAAKLGLTHQALLRRLQKWPELRPTTAPSE
jgi:DNA-binding NtrC family response regulator